MPSIRVSEEVYERVKSSATKFGCCLGAAVGTGFANQEETLDCVQKVGRGAAAMLVSASEYQFTFGYIGFKTRFIISQGFLWQVGRTKNWSQYELLKLTAVPTGLNNSLFNTLKTFRDWSLASVLDYCQVLLEVEAQDWYKALEPKLQQEVHSAYIMDGWDAAKLQDFYSPVITTPQDVVTEPEPVITEPQPEESIVATPQKAKATQLQKRYGISADEWHQKVCEWKKQGLATIDGLLWSCNNKGFWVAT